MPSTEMMNLPDGRPAWRALLDASDQTGVPVSPASERNETSNSWGTHLQQLLQRLEEEKLKVQPAPVLKTGAAPLAATVSKPFALGQLPVSCEANDLSLADLSQRKPISTQEKIALWQRHSQLDADEVVTQVISQAQSPPRSFSGDVQLPPAMDPLVGLVDVEDVLARLDTMEQRLKQEQEEKADLIIMYESMLKERTASHTRDIKVLEEMLAGAQLETERVLHKLHRKRSSAKSGPSSASTASSGEYSDPNPGRSSDASSSGSPLTRRFVAESSSEDDGSNS